MTVDRLIDSPLKHPAQGAGHPNGSVGRRLSLYLAGLVGGGDVGVHPDEGHLAQLQKGVKNIGQGLRDEDTGSL